MTPAQAAAFRLSCELAKVGKVRTHYRPDPGAQEWRRDPFQVAARRTGRRRIITGRGRGGSNRQEIEIYGTRFRSVTEARAALRIAHRTIHKLLTEGKARYCTQDIS